MYKILASNPLIWKKNIGQQVGLHAVWKAMRKMKGENNKKQQQLMESISENEPKELEMHAPAM